MNTLIKFTLFILSTFAFIQTSICTFGDRGTPQINHYGNPYMDSLFGIEHNPFSAINLMPNILSQSIIQELNIKDKTDLAKLIQDKKINLYFYSVIWGNPEIWPLDRLYYLIFHDLVKNWITETNSNLNPDNFNLNIDMGLFEPNGLDYLPNTENLAGPISVDKFAPKNLVIHPDDEALKRSSIGPWFGYELLYSPANAYFKLKGHRIVATFWSSIILPDKKNIFIIFNTLIADNKLKDLIYWLPRGLSIEKLNNFINKLKDISSTIETTKKEDFQALNKGINILKKAINFNENLDKLKNEVKKNKLITEAISAHNLSINDINKDLNQYIDKNNGMTLLMYAANLGLIDLVTLLLDLGADPLIKTKTKAPNIPSNWTALDFAQSQKHKDTIRILQLYNLNALIEKTPDLEEAIKAHNLSIDDVIKNLNQYIDKTNDITLLMYATNLGLPDAVQLLLSHGADKSKKSNIKGIFGGQTALEIAYTRLAQVKSEEKDKFNEIIRLLSEL